MENKVNVRRIIALAKIPVRFPHGHKRPEWCLVDRLVIGKWHTGCPICSCTWFGLTLILILHCPPDSTWTYGKLAEAAGAVNIQLKVNPTQVHDQMGHPVEVNGKYVGWTWKRQDLFHSLFTKEIFKQFWYGANREGCLSSSSHSLADTFFLSHCSAAISIRGVTIPF